MDESKIINVYFISGLGADRKAFERLKLPANYSLHYLDWISPHRKESLNEYAKRLAVSIDTSKLFVVVGLSMGGMIASVLTQCLPPHKTVLISSVASASEFPPLFQLASFTHVYKLIPNQLLRKPNSISYWMFGAKSKNEKKLMQYILSNANPFFVKWSIGAILSWRDKVRPKNIFHIHGSNDKILPIKYTKPDVVIKNGSHFMVWTRADEVSKYLVKALGDRN